MKLALKAFQDEAVTTLLEELRLAQGDSKRRPQAVSLTAPTGAGKTIIATAAIERLVEGDSEASPDANATFLWISDQPELNEQTRRKFLLTSSYFGPSTLRVVDADTFDQRVFDPGVVYFLNTQKLGRDRALVDHGDLRQYTIWDTLRNTIGERAASFFLIIDEAHRGMIQDANERSRANTIIQRFIKGDTQIPPVPLILAISATPGRFNELVRGATTRTLRPVPIDPASVRASGLLKDEIRFTYPKTSQETELTLLRDAARTLVAVTQAWKDYTSAESLSSVRPLLAVQVRDGGPGRLSDTNLPDVIAILRSELGDPPDVALAHAFQEQQTLDVGGTSVRYLAPVDIQDDPSAQVVLFKSALSTGWDCPRAEVMMSFRSTNEPTLIAQLVGRMVRTPLARRILDNDLLNRVQLYLPHYDVQHVEDVIRYLTSDEGGAVPSLDFGIGETVPAIRDLSKAECFAALEKITKYTIPTVRHANQVNRLMKLARLLGETGIEDDAVDLARDLLVERLVEEHASLAQTSEYQQAIAAGTTVTVLDRRRMADGTETETPRELEAASEDIRRLFDNASRRLREGLAEAFVKRRVKEIGTISLARLELVALTTDEINAALSELAQQTAEEWLRKYERKIRKLPSSHRARFHEIEELALAPVTSFLQLPQGIEVQGDESYPDHLYIAADGGFPQTLNGWEEATLLAEARRSDFIGWLRNIPNKPWALSFPNASQSRSVYPDFISFRRGEDGDVIVDILDPHDLSYADAAPRAAGFAQYAERHGRDFGRIELIRLVDHEIQRLDLKDAKTRRRLKTSVTSQNLEGIFEDYATKEPIPDGKYRR